MLKKLRRFLSGENISEPAYQLMRGALIFSVALLVVSLVITLYAGDLTARNVGVLRLAAEIYRAPLGVIIIAAVGAVYIDDIMKR